MCIVCVLEVQCVHNYVNMVQCCFCSCVHVERCWKFNKLEVQCVSSMHACLTPICNVACACVHDNDVCWSAWLDTAAWRDIASFPGVEEGNENEAKRWSAWWDTTWSAWRDTTWSAWRDTTVSAWQDTTWSAWQGPASVCVWSRAYGCVCLCVTYHGYVVCVCVFPNLCTQEEIVSLVSNLHQPHEEHTDIKQSHTKMSPSSIYSGESYQNRVLWLRG